MSHFDQADNKIKLWQGTLQRCYNWTRDHKFVLRTLAYILIILILSGLVKQIIENRELLQECCQHPNLGKLVGALSFVCVAVGLLGWNWLIVLRLLGGKISFQEGLKIYFLTNLGRYLPGSIWHFAGRTVWLIERNISKRASVSSLALEQGATLVAALIAGTLSLIGLVSLNLRNILLFSGLLLVLLILFSIVFKLIISYTKLKQTSLVDSDQHKYGTMSLLALMYFCFWIIYGIGIYILTQAIYVSPFSIPQMLQTIGIVALAWALGYLSLITPGGIGVREGVMVLLLNTFLPMPVASVVALLARAIQITAETLWVIFMIKLHRIAAR